MLTNADPVENPKKLQAACGESNVQSLHLDAVTNFRKIQDLTGEDLVYISKLFEAKKLFAVHSSLFDDYYWMISSVADQKLPEDQHIESNNADGRFPGKRPMLITNDQMRDHRFSLMEPRDFRRWTGCHIVNYSIANYEGGDEWRDREVNFCEADCFSREIQCNVGPRFGNSTVWHLPVSGWAEMDWLCMSISQ